MMVAVPSGSPAPLVQPALPAGAGAGPGASSAGAMSAPAEAASGAGAAASGAGGGSWATSAGIAVSGTAGARSAGGRVSRALAAASGSASTAAGGAEDAHAPSNASADTIPIARKPALLLMRAPPTIAASARFLFKALTRKRHARDRCQQALAAAASYIVRPLPPAQASKGPHA
jgi:hypothetical protein